MRASYRLALAAWIAFHTRSDVSGIASMWSMPSGASASTTALTTVGVAAMVPVSPAPLMPKGFTRSEEHTSELQSQSNLVCRLLLEKKKKKIRDIMIEDIL